MINELKQEFWTSVGNPGRSCVWSTGWLRARVANWLEGEPYILPFNTAPMTILPIVLSWSGSLQLMPSQDHKHKPKLSFRATLRVSISLLATASICKWHIEPKQCRCNEPHEGCTTRQARCFALFDTLLKRCYSILTATASLDPFDKRGLKYLSLWLSHTGCTWDKLPDHVEAIHTKWASISHQPASIPEWR